VIDKESFAEQARRLREERAAREAARLADTSPTAKVEHDPDLIPEVEAVEYGPDPTLEALKRIPIMDAFRTLFPHLTKFKKGRETKFQCPNPDHSDGRDDVPTASFNHRDNDWACHGCPPYASQRANASRLGGDILTLGAIRFGYDLNTYNQPEHFPNLVRELAEIFGIDVTPMVRTMSGNRPMAVVQDETPSTPENSPQKTASSPAVTAGSPNETAGQEPRLAGSPGTPAVSTSPATAPPDPPEPPTRHLSLVEPDEFDWGTVNVEYPDIDFNEFLVPGTFLFEWCKLAEQLKYTKHHFLFTGLPAISLAVRRHLMLADEPPVRSNLYVVLLGESGSTKTKVQSLFIRLIAECFPYDDPACAVKHLSPNSGENLIKELLTDKTGSSWPDNPGVIITNEYRKLAKIIDRQGSTLESYLQDFFDNEGPIIQGLSKEKNAVHNHTLTMVTTTQPDMIKEHVTKDHIESGYANRLIFSYGPPGEDTSWNETILLDKPRELLWEIFQHYQGKFLRLKPTDEALAYWRIFHRDEIIPAKRSGSRLLTRIDLHIKKLMGLFAANEHAEEVTLHHAEQATSLFPYLVKSYEFVQGKVGFGPHEDCHDDIRAYLSKKNVRSGEQILETMRKRGHRYQIVMAVMRAMKDIDEIEPVKVAGKVKPLWRLASSR